MADFEQLETNLGQETEAFDGLLADLLTQWDEQDVELAAEAGPAAQAPVESALAQLSEVMGTQPGSVTGLEDSWTGPAEPPAVIMSGALWPEAEPEPEDWPAGISPIGLVSGTSWEDPELGTVTATALDGGGIDFEPAGGENTSVEEGLPVSEPATGLEFLAGPAGPAEEGVEGEAAVEPEIEVVTDQPAEIGAEIEAAPAFIQRKLSTKTENMLELVRTMYRGIQERKTGQTAAGRDGYVVVRLAGHQFGIPTRRVVETDRLPRVTPLPFVPDFIPGVANLRGEVLPLVDLRLLLGLEPEPEARMVVVRHKDEEPATALVVDGLGGIAWISPSQLSSVETPEEAGEEIGLERLVSASAEHRNRKLEILDLDRLFASRELVELRAH